MIWLSPLAVSVMLVHLPILSLDVLVILLMMLPMAMDATPPHLKNPRSFFTVLDVASNLYSPRPSWLRLILCNWAIQAGLVVFRFISGSMRISGSMGFSCSSNVWYVP